MNRFRPWACALLLAGQAASQTSPPSEAEAAFRDRIRPLFSRYCISCHGPEKPKGKLNLARFETLAALHQDAETWESVVEQLASREMPPKGKPQPTDAERTLAVDWIRETLRREARSRAGDPGPVRLRRLTHAEYDRTVRDLIGVDFRPAQMFPATGAAGEGFSNVGEAQAATPQMMEKYLEAARQAASRLLLLPDGKIRFAEKPVDTFLSAREEVEGKLLAFYRRHGLPAGNLEQTNATAAQVKRTQIYVRDEYLQSFRGPLGDAHAEHQRLWDEIYFVTRYGERIVDYCGAWYEQVLKLGGAPKTRSFNLTRSLKPAQVEAMVREGYKQIQSIYNKDFLAPNVEAAIGELRSCFQELHAFQELRKKVEPDHLKAILDLAARAWRRPLEASEEEDLRKFYRQLRQKESLEPEPAARLLVTRILSAPAFLYRLERWPDGAAPEPVSAWELAGRLSYFLWASMPDEELRRAAASGELLNDEALVRQTRRMLAHPRARGLAEEFFGQWLGFSGFDRSAGPDPKRFPGFTSELRQAMVEEPVLFFEDLVRSDGSVRGILQADHTFVNAALAGHYGLEGVQGETMRRVDGLANHQRGGVLGMASLLARTSEPLRTSPVRRGHWVATVLLGVRLPLPPPNVANLPADVADADPLTLRQRLERHRGDPACAGCHARFDHFGLSLEGFDPIGRSRSKDSGDRPIDARVESPDGLTFSGFSGLREYLGKPAQEEKFLRNLSAKLLGYALGRSVRLSDQPLLERIQGELKAGDYRLSAAVLAVVTSRPFRFHRGRKEQSP